MEAESNMRVANSSALEQILELSEEGINVAQGEGTPFQRTAVTVALVYGLVALAFLGRSNIALFLVLPILILLIDFLSGFVHWFFDTQVKPSGSFLGRIAIDFLDHHVRPRRTVDVGFFVSAWRPALMGKPAFVNAGTFTERQCDVFFCPDVDRSAQYAGATDTQACSSPRLQSRDKIHAKVAADSQSRIASKPSFGQFSIILRFHRMVESYFGQHQLLACFGATFQNHQK